MDLLKKIFPISFKYKDSTNNLVVGIIIYIIAAVIAGLVLFLAGEIIGWLPGFVGSLLGWVLRIVGTLVEVYVVVGIVLEVLAFLKVIED